MSASDVAPRASASRYVGPDPRQRRTELRVPPPYDGSSLRISADAPGWPVSTQKASASASGGLDLLSDATATRGVRPISCEDGDGLTLHRLGYERCMPSALESLSNIPLFADLSARQLRKVLKSAGEDRYEEGDVIVSEGGRTQTLFVILEGTARVVRNHRTVARRSVGEFFGEISMIDLRQRSATVIAETPMRCLALYHDDLRKLVMGDPQVAWSLVQTLASRLRDDWERPLDRKRATRPGVSRAR